MLSPVYVRSEGKVSRMAAGGSAEERVTSLVDMQLRTAKRCGGPPVKQPMGNNILKVQGLAALDYIKFTTFSGPISSAEMGSRGLRREFLTQ